MPAQVLPPATEGVTPTASASDEEELLVQELEYLPGAEPGNGADLQGKATDSEALQKACISAAALARKNSLIKQHSLEARISMRQSHHLSALRADRASKINFDRRQSSSAPVLRGHTKLPNGSEEQPGWASQVLKAITRMSTRTSTRMSTREAPKAKSPRKQHVQHRFATGFFQVRNDHYL